VRSVISEYPILVLEFNKLLPKSSKLVKLFLIQPLVDKENADSFLLKIKNRDEYAFRECMKAILSLKNGEIMLEKLVARFEELLANYPDLMEEAYIYTDPKKVNFFLNSAKLS
jgi:histone deacetylase complex regulatory component SIN3